MWGYVNISLHIQRFGAKIKKYVGKGDKIYEMVIVIVESVPSFNYDKSLDKQIDRMMGIYDD